MEDGKLTQSEWLELFGDEFLIAAGRTQVDGCWSREDMDWLFENMPAHIKTRPDMPPPDIS